MLRRTGIGTLGNPGKSIVDKVTGIAASMLNWDEQRITEEKSALMKVYEIL
jgi:glycerol-3-phosphate dehydrogenase